MTMNRFTRITIAVACALGATAVVAQTVQPRATQPRPPMQIAQSPAQGTPGSWSGGASQGITGAAQAGSVGGATAGGLVFITMGAMAVAGAASDSGAATSHTP